MMANMVACLLEFGKSLTTGGAHHHQIDERSEISLEKLVLDLFAEEHMLTNICTHMWPCSL